MQMVPASQTETVSADLFLPGVPAEEILAAYAKAPGREDVSGGLDSPRSSAALAANAFGFFWHRPSDLPPLPSLGDLDWPATSVRVEQTARFPWSGGMHPWLDVLVETPRHLIGIEIKRYEHVGTVTWKEFSNAYRRPVWGERMGPFERMRDQLSAGRYKHLHAAQLVKHAFGLRTEAGRAVRQERKPVLLYLYAEPATWPDGRPVDRKVVAQHAEEVREFAATVEAAEVRFAACTYSELLGAMRKSPSMAVRVHADALAERFGQ